MNKITLSTALIFGSMTFNAQIKVWSGTNTPTVIGSTSSTSVVGHELQVIGKSIFTSGTGTVTSAPYIMGTNTYSSANAPDYTWKKDSTTGIFHPSSGNVIGFSTNGAERMRLTSNGLLIGTASDPTNVRLYVNAASNSQAIYSASNYSTSYNYHQINNVNQATTKALVVQLNGTDKFIVTGGGDAWAYSTVTWSDKNLKENIDTLKGALNKVLQLQGFTYNYKASEVGISHPRKQMGLIAQEVEAVVPEAVSTNDKGLKGIAYQNITALLIEAIKEQNKKIAQLQNDLNACCSKSGNRMLQNSDINSDNIADLQTKAITEAKLWQNIPNPFSQTTTIKCFIPDAGKTAVILVFDLTGALKKTVAVNGKGEVNVSISAKELVAGMYHYSLIVDGQEIDTKKMILTE